METPVCAADTQQAKYEAEGGWRDEWQAKSEQGMYLNENLLALTLLKPQCETKAKHLDIP